MKSLFHNTCLRGIQVMAVVVSGWAMVSCDQAPVSEQRHPDEATASAQNVEVIRVTRQDLSRGVTLTAEFKPYQEVEIHAKVAGYVKQINVDVGDHAKAGDVLATLEIPELQDDLKKAEAAVLTADQEVKSSEASFEETDQIDTRLQAAGKEAPGLIAQQELDTAAAKNRAGAADLQAAKQRVVEAQANADQVRSMFAYSTITAPFDGVVTKRYADTGALIQAGTASNTQAMPLLSFAELHRLRLEFPVPESAVAYVHVGNPVEVTVVSSGKTFLGTVSRFAQKVDTETRTMLTEVDVDKSRLPLYVGMYATVRLYSVPQKKNALGRCPSNASRPATSPPF